MSIKVVCTQCGASHLVNNALAGRRVRCRECDTVVDVPEQEVELESEEEEEEVAVEPVIVEEAVEVQAVAAVAEPEPSPSPPPQPSTVLDDDEDDEVFPRQPRPEEEMDMTPMVDVTFLLLIFFMVTAAFSLQKSIEMPRQQTDAPSTSVVEEETEDLDMVEVEVDEFGSFLVMAPEFEEETPSKQQLIRSLRKAIEGNSAGMRLAIKVHELAKLHALVDAMDAGSIAGYAELEVTQVEEFN